MYTNYFMENRQHIFGVFAKNTGKDLRVIHLGTTGSKCNIVAIFDQLHEVVQKCFHGLFRNLIFILLQGSRNIYYGLLP